MVVDGDPTALVATASVLRTAGFNVVAEASAAAEAVAAARAVAPDVVVLDIELPEDGAPAAANQIRDAIEHRLDIIAVASFSAAHRLGEMVVAGTSAYVVKGKPAELVGAIRAVRAGTGLLSAEASRPVLEEVQNLYQRERSRNMELERTVSQLQTLSVTDWLTGLKNHGYFFDRLTEEMERSRRYDRPVAVVMADLDDFKSVNDTFGHAAGDSVLRSVGEVFRAELREVDIACRLGGEEFGIIMPETDGAGAVQVCERLRIAVAGAPVAGVGSVTISAGVAVFPRHGDSRDELVRSADEALYFAKTNGKNRVEFSGSAGSPPTGQRSVETADHPKLGLLMNALRGRSAGLAEHSERVAGLATELGSRLGVGAVDLDHLRSAALLHDIGRIALPDSILRGDGPLGIGDWEHIKEHPRVAFDMLEGAFSNEVRAIVRSHHEHLDGSGYPDGLAGDDVPVLARIILVCDAFDAMISERPYRPPLPKTQALAELDANVGKLFDAEVVAEFARMIRGEGEVVVLPFASAS